VVGALAPDFGLETVGGDSVHLSDFKGQPVLLNFWATWCGPCRLEMPAIQARHEQFGDQFTVLAIDFDEPAVLVRDFVDELGLTFLTLLDPGGEVQALFRVRGYPSSVFIDAEGVIQVYHIGVMTEEQLDGYLRQVGVGL
jgi:peroxiredoxin